MHEKNYKNFVRGTQEQNFRRKLSLKSRPVIPKEDMLFRVRPKLKVNVQASCVGLQNYKAILKSSWIKITLIIYLCTRFIW